MTTLAAPSAVVPVTVPSITTRPRSRWFRPGWPLAWLYFGFPIWWATGLGPIVFLVLAVPMAVELLRRGRPKTPPLFGALLLFLGWMAAGVSVLWVQAPGTVPDHSLMKLVPFAYRGGWYLACTVVLLYVLNLREEELPSERVVRMLGFMFVVTTIGGLLGVVAPTLEFKSLLELVLPNGVTSDRFISNLIHPKVSTLSDFLGYQQARPIAPFAFANAWGNNLGLFLPFFVVGWLGPSSTRGRRWFGVVMLAIAIVPIVYSLNRGVWLGLGVGAVWVCLRLALAGRSRPLIALMAGVLVVAATISMTSLGDTIEQRIATPHSNERRESVAETVIGATMEGSPILGYGSTRDVAGNFSSIAGGKSEECAQCGAPPLGTQGFLWRLVFTTGFIGTALFAAFQAAQFWRHMRLTTPYAMLGTTLILMSVVFFLVYDSLEAPIFTLMIGIGLMNRERLALDAA